jgi:PPM family protein phosphatase
MKKKSKLWIHEEMREVTTLTASGRRGLACFSTPYSGFKGGNQDCMGFVQTSPGTEVLFVADGAGGMANGDKASALAVQTLTRSLRKNKSPDLSAAILSAVFKCQEELMKWTPSTGTTLTIAEVKRNRVRVYHCGDSEMLLTTGEGEILYQTVSHSPTGYLQAAGALSSRNALIHPERSFISNFLGAEKNFYLQVSPWLPFQKDACLILASDGLFDNLSLVQVQKIIQLNGVPEAIATVLVERATQQMDRAVARLTRQGKADDLSLMILKSLR